MGYTVLSDAGLAHCYHLDGTTSCCGRHSLDHEHTVAQNQRGKAVAFPPDSPNVCRKCVRHYFQCRKCRDDNPFVPPGLKF